MLIDLDSLLSDYCCAKCGTVQPADHFTFDAQLRAVGKRPAKAALTLRA